MFAIRLLPPSQVGPDGQRMGEIIVGDFHERFTCSSEDFTGMENQWREQLQALVNHAPVVALRHDPRFAWIIYREGDACYIQEHLSLDGDFAIPRLRETKTEDGDKISEWKTRLSAIVEFLRE